MELVVTIGMLIFFLLVRMRLSVERPGAAQQIVEMTHGLVCDQAESIIGHGSERFVPYVTTVFVFILLCNLIGLIPGFITPTGKPYVPLALAALTFLYYQYHGLRANGPAYIKQFLGPIWWISPLMLPIEIISHLARVLSLTVRLYANMFASDMVILVFFSLVPVLGSVPFLALHAAVSVIQAVVFMLLTLIYLSQAVSHEH
jgi:F-type H+-transporting ATPase subunit a